jgi:hypothetical protein
MTFSPTRLSFLVLAAIIIVLGAITYVNSSRHDGNYAKETAKPIEDALTKAGATKMCSNGDSGKGIDNKEPWHEAYYVIPKSRDKTVELINDIANANGYKLSHASKDNRNFRGAPADEFIGNWYFDNSTKTAPYSGLKSGNIQLSFGLNNDGAHKISGTSCGKSEVVINSDQNNTMITTSVRLPDYK